MEMVIEQTEAEPPRRLRLREEDETSIFDIEYRLQATDTGTRFTQLSEFEWKRLPRFLHGTFERGPGAIFATSYGRSSACSRTDAARIGGRGDHFCFSRKAEASKRPSTAPALVCVD
jgi:hypothetical protein